MARLVAYSTAKRTVVNSSASAVALLPVHNRFGGKIWNASSAILYVLLKDPNVAETVSATTASEQVAAGATFNIPEGFSGAIDGIWASANGSAQITELV